MPASASSKNRFLPLLVVWLLLVWAVAAIEPFDRRDWLLENLLVFIYGGLLVASYRRFAFSNLSYGLFGVFLTLHMIGAHYTYAETPIGFWLQSAFELERNHYDRIVHFAYGLLCAYPFRDILVRAAGVKVGWSYLMAVCGILAFSGFYEALEMVVAMIVSPELGMAYLGTQGDVWDAQKDSLLAFTGAVIAMGVDWRVTRAHHGIRSGN